MSQLKSKMIDIYFLQYLVNIKKIIYQLHLVMLYLKIRNKNELMY